MKRGMRPIAHALHEAMLDRVKMDIIDMPGKVVFVSDGVLPETILPSARSPFGRRFNSIPASINALLKCPLIRRQRPEKSASFGGNEKIACK